MSVAFSSTHKSTPCSAEVTFCCVLTQRRMVYVAARYSVLASELIYNYFIHIFPVRQQNFINSSYNEELCIHI